jgi:hypothetical protein
VTNDPGVGSAGSPAAVVGRCAGVECTAGSSVEILAVKSAAVVMTDTVASFALMLVVVAVARTVVADLEVVARSVEVARIVVAENSNSAVYLVVLARTAEIPSGYIAVQELAVWLAPDVEPLNHTPILNSAQAQDLFQVSS